MNCVKRVITSGCWRLIFFVVVFFMVYITASSPVDALGDNINELSPVPEWKRRRIKSSECRLGGKRYALNETWSPDLGPPFGVWNCVKCTCKAVRKKNRVVAKQDCRNVKTECPKITCKNPLLPEGACCKICPTSSELEGIKYQKEEPQEPLTEFAVLLNGRTSFQPLTTTFLATGRLTLRRGTLHFSFLLRKNTPAPSSIQFLRKSDQDQEEILEELEAQPTPYESTNNRICGTWTRVPRHYRSLLRNEKMWVALVPPSDNPGDIISGQLKRYKGVETEVFSALLAPSHEINQTLIGGGTAIISVSAPSDSLHIQLVFNGIFRSNDDYNVTLVVELEPERKLEAVQDRVIIKRSFSDVNQVELMTTLGETSLRLLTRGRVFMRVWTESAPHLVIEGPVMTRVGCNVYSAILTSQPEEHLINSPVAYASGWGLIMVSNEGDFQYQVQTVGLSYPVLNVSLIWSHHRRSRVVEDLTKNYKDGWVNGTYTRPTYRDLDSLLRGKLEIVVLTVGGEKLSGTLNQVSFTEALRSPLPVLLASPSSWLAAAAWVAVDSACVMHYDVYISGAPPYKTPEPSWQLVFRENDTVWDLRLKQTKELLEENVTGWSITSHTTLLMNVSLTRLKKGAAFLDLKFLSPGKDKEPEIILTGNIFDVQVPSQCLIEEQSPSKPCMRFQCLLSPDEQQILSKDCMDEDKHVYEQGHGWVSPKSPCKHCMCIAGRIKCQDEPCPPLPCKNPVYVPGQCCPACPGEIGDHLGKLNCSLNGVLYSVGSSWHPFLPPKGFNKCVTCSCIIGSRGTPEITYIKTECPKLSCSDTEAMIIDGSCCPVCPHTTPIPSLPNRIQSSDTIDCAFNDPAKCYTLQNGGCLIRQKTVKQNGDEWNPRIHPMGVYKCITCRCKDSNVTCSWNDCCPHCKSSTNLSPGHKKIFKPHHSKRKKYGKRKKHAAG